MKRKKEESQEEGPRRKTWRQKLPPLLAQLALIPGLGSFYSNVQKTAEVVNNYTVKRLPPIEDAPSNTKQQRYIITEIQLILKIVGFDPGPIDGIMGPKTREALRQFQESRQLAPTGKVDEQTLRRLGGRKTLITRDME